MLEKKSSPVVILLSTFNGEAFLAEQIESIRAQTYTDWTLCIRDDGSIDHTLTIIKHYCSLDKRIIFIEDKRGNLKPCQSFSALTGYFLLNTTAEFAFYADQDDIWLKDKLALQIEVLHHLQKINGMQIPALVFSDLKVVDQTLNLINESFFNFENYQPQPHPPLKTLLIHNYVTGCTMGINRALAQLAYPIPDTAIMHDWWLALCAAATGQLQALQQPTVLYRQHHKNTIGSSGHVNKIKKILTSWTQLSTHYKNRKKLLLQRFQQADVLYSRMNLSNKNAEIIADFCSLAHKKFLMRLRTCVKLKLQPIGWLRKVFFMLIILTLAKDENSG